MDSEIQGITPQPTPTSGKDSKSVTEFVVNILKEEHAEDQDAAPITPKVVDDLLARREAGVKKYGRELESFNGRDAMIDAYHEAVDLAMYLGQLVMEGSSAVAPSFSLALSTTLYLRHLLEERSAP
jgi:hypothetical protein